MLMLSFIAERLSNFMKLYFNNKKIWIPFFYWENKPKNYANFRWGFSTRLRILANRQPTESAEKEREYRILTINIVFGILLATLINANFFEIISVVGKISEGDSELNIISGWSQSEIIGDLDKYIKGAVFHILLLWSVSLMLFNRLDENKQRIEPQWRIRIPFFVLFGFSIIIFGLSVCGKIDFKKDILINIVEHSVGYIITGIFLSLGSKFWHDLLDLLFKYKNVHQTINSKSTYSDFGKPESLMALANTSHYDVANQLIDKYRDGIKNIDGVRSVGLVSELDKFGGYYKRVIEVEFTNETSQQELIDLSKSAFIVVNHNTFYLKDYLKLTYTSNIIANSANIIDKIKNSEPVCYSYNIKNEKENKNIYGSFSVTKEDGKFYAISNIHVFAYKDELKRIHKNKEYILKAKSIEFVVGNKTYKGTIVDKAYNFSNYESKKDYCKCSISKQLYEAYNKLIKPNEFTNNLSPNSYMNMFGATSKIIDFKPIKYNIHWVNVDYKNFRKDLHLYKIRRTTGKTISGDSGGAIFYKTTDGKGNEFINKGMLVAASDSYSYIFLM